MPKVQVYVSEELAERVASLAEGDDRTVSQWIRLLLEREVWQEATAPLVDRPARVIPQVRALMEEPSALDLCAHANVRKESGVSGGLVKVCRDCGERGLS